MKPQILIALTSSVFLAGCMQGAEPKGPPIEPTLKNPAISQNRIVGYTEPVMRTFVSVADEEKQVAAAQADTPYPAKSKEVTGLACRLDSAELKASFVTPAVVRLPKFKGKPTKIHLNCASENLEGDVKMQATLDGVIVGGASIAGLVAAAVTAGIAASKDQWSYGASDIAFRIPVEQK